MPVGNPAPDFAPHVRPGDNLFTNSAVVLDAPSGALRWWYQAAPNDGFDYDLAATPMLYATARGEPRMAGGSKDGHVYAVDRRTHALAFKTPVTTILNADRRPTPEGVRACPGPLGGAEWNGPAYDPQGHTIYVGSVDWCATFRSGTGEQLEHEPGDLYMGTAHAGDPAEQATGWVTALDGATGAVRWRFRAPMPIVAGVTPTAGGLVFTGDLAGNFYALDKASGKALLSTNVGGAGAGGVVTYAVSGRQYVATTAGNISRSTFQTAGSPRLVVMAIDVPAGQQARRVALPEVALQVAQEPGGGPAVPGKGPYEQFCAGCHGTWGEGGGNGPSLVASGARHDVDAVAEFIRNPNPPMPKLHPSPLNDEAVVAVAEYVRTLQQGASQR